ncbi:MAG TPA: filamentous hemagglutinin N-terminal domain-containing protein, partial [Opitutaceae bacterium]
MTTKAFLIALAAGSLTVPAWASTPTTGPSNLIVVNGSVTTTGGGASSNSLTVTSTTENSVLSWTNFWDGTANGGTSTASDQITFTLPSAASSILNQVTGGGMTTINGKISSNGSVYLINPNGVAIGNTGVINAAGFYVSTWLEPLSYFETNGSLAIFGSGWQSLTTNLTSGSVTVAPNATLQTVGGTGTIGFAANSVALSSTVFGKALLVDGGTNPSINVGQSGPSTVEGNLVVWAGGGNVTLGSNNSVDVQGTTFVVADTASNVTVANGGGVVFQGATSINSAGGLVTIANGSNVLEQGSLTINSGTGDVVLSNTGTTTIQGNLTITS